MDPVTKEALLSALRSLLIALGSFLSTHGWITQDQVNQLVGPLMVIIPIVWGVWNKYNAEKKTQARVEQAYNAGSSQMPMPDPKKTPPTLDQGAPK